MTDISKKEVHTTNNFDFLRFLFACLVVISHSYPLSGSNESAQWIYHTKKVQITYASLGLNGFFVISGYFIFQSMMRSKSLKTFYFKRFLRLFPGLFVVLLVSLLLSPFVYESTLPLLANKEFYTYLPFNISLYGFQSGIKGIFDNNAYHSINGSLWTIRYEFSLYIAVSILFYFRNKPKVVFSLLLFAFLMFYILYVFFIEKVGSAKIFGMLGSNILYLGLFFILGSLMASVQLEKMPIKKSFFAFLIVLIVLSIYFNIYHLTEHFLYSILVLLVGFKALPFFSTFGKVGDMSYGIYIYSFPIQQILMYFFNFNIFQLMTSSLLLSMVFGYFSWHLVEKRALRFNI